MFPIAYMPILLSMMPVKVKTCGGGGDTHTKRQGCMSKNLERTPESYHFLHYTVIYLNTLHTTFTSTLFNVFYT